MAISVQNLPASRRTSGSEPATDTRAMSIATMLFFMWGFLTCLNDILIPHLKSIFDLNYAQALLVQFSFFSSYAVFAFPAGRLVEWRGYKGSMVIGLCIMAVGALLFLPASSFASFPLFLGALVVLAAGITTLQVAANPYVANLGPERTASSRLNLAQAFNSLGTTVAPFFGAAFILANVPAAPANLSSLPATAIQEFRAYEASSVRLPYLGIALTLLVLAVALAFLKLPSMDFTRDFRPGELDQTGTPDTIWRHPHLLFGALAIFLYVGAEVSIGSFLINYFALPNIGGFPAQTAAKFVALYWLGAMIGRFVGSAVLQRLNTGIVLGFCAVVAACLVLLSILSSGYLAMGSIIAVGLFNSVMFPNIFALGLHGLGALTSRGSSLLVTAIVGGALIPLAEGAVADRIGVQHAFFLPVLCYLYITAFGFFNRGLATSDLPPAAA